MKIIYVDIDETICHRESSTDFGVTHDYTKAKPITENIPQTETKQIPQEVFWPQLGTMESEKYKEKWK